MIRYVRIISILVLGMILNPVFAEARLCSVSKTTCDSATPCPGTETCDAEMNDYCVTPPFITAGIKPNLLMLIDNSASMYDLAYTDKGRKQCSLTVSDCFTDAECPSGETCSVFARQPSYCYDKTYKSATKYYGYFDIDTFYYYRPPASPTPFKEGDFVVLTLPFPSDCGSVSAGSTTKSIPNTMCVEYTATAASSTLHRFIAKGNYLNWLTASKFDIQKKILTGGKFDGSGLIPESRGCVGYGFTKDAITADFVNYNTPTYDTNTSLGVTFNINGPQNAYNEAAPSAGGQTYINLYSGSGSTTYDFPACQQALAALATGGNADIKKWVDACLGTDSKPGYCDKTMAPNLVATWTAGTKACSSGVECVRDATVAQAAKVCSLAPNIACTADANCSLAEGYFCATQSSRSCTGLLDTTSCKVTTPAVSGKCTSALISYCKKGTSGAGCILPEKIANVKQAGTTCSTDAGCTAGDWTAQTGACEGEAPATSTDYGPCTYQAAASYGTCVANDIGPCILPGGAIKAKTNVVFQQSMQECWKIRPASSQVAPQYGFSNMNTVKQQCPDLYANYKSCSNNNLLQCTADADCGSGNTCEEGPDAIGPGSPAYLCGRTYVGQCFVKSGSTWVLKGGSPACQDFPDRSNYASDAEWQANSLAYQEWTYCQDVQATTPVVVDPTDSPADTATFGNLPPILSGISVNSQLGLPIATMRAKVASATAPTGLIQQFGRNIRLGAMSFNAFGSASETALIGIPKVCSNAPHLSCTKSIDCGGTNTCDPTTSTTNLDGSRILYPIGKGLCATMTSTPCKTDSGCFGLSCLNGYCGTLGTTKCTTVANCSGSSQACIPDSTGDHTTNNTLIKVLDDIRATSWTPLAEGFYNIIGYFAKVPTGTNAGKSRTDLRINAINTTSTDYTDATTAPIDFNEDYNPSELRCQQNYVLLVSDGSSTADRNTNVSALATRYASAAGITQTACTGAATGTTTDYGGNNNLPVMTWLAKNRNIGTFAKDAVSTEKPNNARESISTYVVFNGESNGASGDCDSLTLMTKTAANGGTTLKQATDYESLRRELTTVLQDVSAKAASGTAASILSNSEGSGANILQAVFFPKKIFEKNTSVNWIGEMHNLWYYVDPYINNSTIREDTDGDYKLHLVSDYVTRFTFDNASDKTMVQRYQDTDGDGTGDTVIGGLVEPDTIKSLWKAGDLLWRRDLVDAPRTIYAPLLADKATHAATVTGQEVGSTGLIKFSWASPDNSAPLQPFLQYPSNNAGAKKLMKWVHGYDDPDTTNPDYTSPFRSRTVLKGTIPAATISTDSTDTYVTNPRDRGIGVWKMGDIISSTPRVQSTVRLNTYNLPSPGGYSDNSYLSYINSEEYKNERGMVYVGSNDGMFHAFDLGILSVESKGMEKAELKLSPDGFARGAERWAFIPRNSLPYLKYMADPTYGHLYFIDGRTSIFDASIGYTDVGGCTKANYAACDKLKSSSVVNDTTNRLDPAKNTWRTVVIGGMGLGGASAKSCTVGTSCVQTPIDDPIDSTKGLGYSSYFALDVTDPIHPAFLWEFSHPEMGYSLSGPAIVRVGDAQKNGNWYAVFGSGPTGPIDTTTHQFMGISNQNLKFFVVDLQTGALVKTIDTGIANAFAGSMINGSIDVDRASPTVTGNYQDDAIYVGYVQKDTSTNTWTKGGIGRIKTMESANPADTTNPWVWNTIMNDTGPVTTAVTRLQDKKNRNLWLFFGSGRYYYRDSTSLDDFDGRRALFGVKEPCYNTLTVPGNFLDKSCSATVSTSSLKNQTTSVSTITATDAGWTIDLDESTATEGAERVVTDTVALTNGTVFYTSFKPTMDTCGFGGNSFLWSVKYDTGGQAAANTMKGKALIQLSTGEFKEVDFSTAFTDKLNRRMATPMTGKPPSDAPPIISSSQNKPIKRVLHIQER